MIIGLIEETMKGRVGRSPIRLRSLPDWIAFAVRLDCVRVTMTFREFFSMTRCLLFI